MRKSSSPITRFLLSILWLSVSLCAGCSSSDPAIEEEPFGGIAGSVSDQTTGEPVATVNVTLSPGGKSTVTGNDGSFSFVDLKPGAYMIDIRKEGYDPNSRSVDVVAGKSTEAHLTIERVPAIVTADRTELDFGSDYGVTSLSFNIVNNYYTDLEWEIVASCGWIKNILPLKGSLAHGQTGTIIVQIDRENLQDGDNKTVLVLTTAGVGGREITVKAVGVAKKTAALNTLEPTSIAASSATVNGEIIDSGYPTYTERGFVYSESQMPTIDQTIQKLTVPITNDSKFSAKVVGLTLGKTYYVRAYAVNPVGIAYSSNQVSFTTVAVAPTVSITKVDNIDKTAHTAIAHGSVVSTGDPTYTERGFVYSDVNSVPTIYNKSVIVEGSGTGVYDGLLSDLAVEATYYVRAYAKNDAGIVYSNNVITFSTEEELPQVATLEPTDTDNTTYSATLRGQIVSSGDPAYIERGFVYSTEFNAPTINDTKLVVEGSGRGTFEARAKDFSSEKTTYVRAYATNHKGTAYGKTVELFSSEFIELPAAGIAVQRKDIGYGYWSSVNAMCENSVVAGKTDWRLPTKDELMAMYNERKYIGGFTTADYEYKSRYWSSSIQDNNYYHYYIYFYDGSISWAVDSNNSRYYSGRCVRTLNPAATTNQ